MIKHSDKLSVSDGSIYDPAKGRYGKPIAWFATNKNKLGFWVYKLDKADLAWLKNSKESTKNVYRVVSDENHTNIMKIDMKKGKVVFFDNKKYEDTDKISWEKQSYIYKMSTVTQEGAKIFGVI